MNIYMQIGTDAGYVYIGRDGKIHRVPGWSPEAISSVTNAINVLRSAAQIKEPAVQEAAIKAVMSHVQEQVGQHMKDGGVLVVG
jgi:hypothetical protein